MGTCTNLNLRTSWKGRCCPQPKQSALHTPHGYGSRTFSEPERRTRGAPPEGDQVRGVPQSGRPDRTHSGARHRGHGPRPGMPRQFGPWSGKRDQVSLARPMSLSIGSSAGGKVLCCQTTTQRGGRYVRRKGKGFPRSGRCYRARSDNAATTSESPRGSGTSSILLLHLR